VVLNINKHIQRYINEMIADMNFNFTYQDVKEDYNVMVKASYNNYTFTFTETKKGISNSSSLS
jgi:hypothetical protein